MRPMRIEGHKVLLCFEVYTRKTPLSAKINLILLDKALSIERKEVSLRSEIFVIYISKSRRNEKE